MIICALIASQAQSAVKIENSVIDTHLNGFVSTYAVLSDFVKVVVKSVRLSESQPAIQAVETFKNRFDFGLSIFTSTVRDVQSFVKENWNVHEEDKGECRYVAPDGAQGLNFELHRKEWERLQSKQKEHITGLMENFATLSWPYGPQLVHTGKLQCYLSCLDRLGDSFQKLSADLAVAKKENDLKVGIWQDFKCVLQTQSALSDFMPIVVKSVYLSASKKVMQDTEIFQKTCDREFSELNRTVEEVQSFVKKNFTVHEAEKSASQEYRYVAPDGAQGFNVELHRKEWERLTRNQKEYITGLVEKVAKFETLSRICRSSVYTVNLKCYLARLDRLGNHLNKLLDDLVLAKKNSDLMLLPLKGFVSTHAVLSECVSVVVDSKQATQAAEMFKNTCERELSECNSIVEAVESFVRVHCTVHEEEKSASQEYRYVAPDGEQGFNVDPHFQEWKRVAGNQREHVTALMNVFSTELVGGTLCAEWLERYLAGVDRLGDSFQQLSDDLALAKQKSEIMVGFLQDSKYFLQTHAELSEFMSVVDKRVPLSADDKLQRCVITFRDSCESQLSRLRATVKGMQLLVERHCTVPAEEKGDSQAHRYVVPDGVQGFNIDPHFQEWKRLRGQQNKYAIALMNVFATRHFGAGGWYVRNLQGYLDGVDRLGESLQKLSDDLALAKQESESMVGFLQDSKCFLQTHVELSEFMSVVTTRVPLSEDDKLQRCVITFRDSCESQLSCLRATVKGVQFLVDRHCVVPEEEKGDSPEYRYVVPDGVQGFNIEPHFQEWKRLQRKQSEHVDALRTVCATRDLYRGMLCDSSLKGYLEGVDRLGDSLQQLSGDLALAKQKSDQKSDLEFGILRDSQFVLQTHAELSKFMSVVGKSVSLSKSKNKRVVCVAETFETSCDCALSALSKKIQYVQSLVKKSCTVHEAKKGDSQEYRCVAFDGAQGFNVEPHFQELKRLQRKQSEHVAALIEKMKVDSHWSYALDLEDYISDLAKLGNSLQKLSDNLALAQQESDRMVLVLQNFMQTQKKFSYLFLRVSQRVSVVLSDTEKTKSPFMDGRIKASLQSFEEKLLTLETIALEIQEAQNLPATEEEKGDIQEHRVISHDDNCDFETYFQEYQGLQEQQETHSDELSPLLWSSLYSPLVVEDFCDKQSRNLINYRDKLRDPGESLRFLVYQLQTFDRQYNGKRKP